MARRNWFVAGILILAAWGMVSISFQGCSTTPAAPVTVTQGVTLIATPPPSTVAGRDWTYATLGAAFSNRYGHASVVYNNLMWVIGGFDGVYYVNDVWSSADGKTWTQMLANNASPGSGQF